MKLKLFFIILFIPFLLRAQVSSEGLSQSKGLGKNVYGLGFTAGWAEGIGVSFRTHLPSNSSFQGVFGIIKTKDKLALSVGAGYQYDIVRSKASRFFVGSALAYNYLGKGKNEVDGPFRVGIGLGGEMIIKDALHADLQGMFTFFSDGRVLPLPQIGIHYYFN